MLWQQTWAAARLQIIAKVPHTLRVDYQLCQRANKRGLCKQWSETKNKQIEASGRRMIQFRDVHLKRTGQQSATLGNLRLLRIYESILVLGKQVPKREMSAKALSACAAMVRTLKKRKRIKVAYAKMGLRCLR